MAIKPRSPLWYELPLLFSIVGGIIAYVKIKKDDPIKARRCIFIGIVVTIPLVISLALFTVIGSDTFFVVASESMSPQLEVYDVVRVNNDTTFEEIAIGDIIAFNRPSDHDVVILHRVVSIINDDPKTIKTQGDANPSSISGTDFPITEKEYIGKAIEILPQVGYVTQLLKPPVNYVIIVAELGIYAIPVILHLKFNKEKKTLSSND